MDWLRRIRDRFTRHPAAGLDAGQMHQVAELACEREEWPRALTWLERAIELAPGSARLWTDRGFVLDQLGDLEEAYSSYMTGSRLGDDGEPIFFASLIRLRQGRVEEAGRLVVRAIALSPEVALDMEDDPELEPMLRLPHVRAARRAAIERL